MLPGTGRGGYEMLGGRLWRSRYVRLGPMPTVLVLNNPIGGLYLDGLPFPLDGGTPGLSSAEVRPICSGTRKERMSQKERPILIFFKIDVLPWLLG